MQLALKNDPVPVLMDEDGVLRISATRIPLDSVTTSFKAGATAEEIAFQ